MATTPPPPPPPKYHCKLCSRTFTNAKSIGGHMKAHLAKLKLSMPPKIQQQDDQQQQPPMSDSSSSSQDQKSPKFRMNIEEKTPSSSSSAYGLRENPRKSFRFVDPEVFTCDPSLVVIHDRESETESKTLTRVRSKRTRKPASGGVKTVQQGFEPKMQKLELARSDESMPETEQMSSVSDTTPEEEVAISLMMLSRDNRVRVITDDNKVEFRKIYQCEVCYKVFRSSQALGGHRITHRKNNHPIEKGKRARGRPMWQSPLDTAIAALPEEIENTRTRAYSEVERDDGVHDRIYECPFCHRVFCSGQALGGHKRSHLITPPDSKFDTNSIDLNIAAAMEDEDCSVVSDAEHFDPIERSY